MTQNVSALKNQKRYPMSHAASVALRVSRKTLHRALRGEIPNPALVDRYRTFVIGQLDKLIGPRGATAVLSSHAANQKRKTSLTK